MSVNDYSISCSSEEKKLPGFILPFYSIDKWSSCGCALEHLVSSGTKIMKNEPNCMPVKLGKDRETNKQIPEGKTKDVQSCCFCAANLQP